jgi:EF-hand domain pair
MLTDFQKRKLMKLFSMYDACNLGVLKISDFECLAQRLADLRGWQPNTEPYEDITSKYLLLWNRMRSEIKHKVLSQENIEEATTQIRSQVNLEEWFIYFDIVLNDPSYHEETLALTETVFAVVDTDESGHLDKEEWANFFRVYNIPVIYVEETFAKIDLDGNGVLTKDEVLSMIKDFYFSNDPDASGNYMFGPI